MSHPHADDPRLHVDLEDLHEMCLAYTKMTRTTYRHRGFL